MLIQGNNNNTFVVIIIWPMEIPLDEACEDPFLLLLVSTEVVYMSELTNI
jgi:hypothetical protein